jgi:hypothetical protein
MLAAAIAATAFCGRAGAQAPGLDAISKLIEGLPSKVNPAPATTTAKDLVRQIATTSEWWTSRIPPRRPGGWVTYHDAGNIKLRLLNVTFGAEIKDPPIEDASEVYRFSNCLDARTIHKELSVKKDSVVGATVTNSITTEQELKFDIGTNPQVASFLNVNLSLAQKITVNLTTVQNKQETASVSETWTEDMHIKSEFLFIVLAKRTFQIRYLPFEADVVIDADVYLEWFNPAGDTATAHQKRWRPLTMFAPSAADRTKKIKGKIYSGATSIRDIVYTGKSLDPKIDAVCKVE